MNRRDRRSVIMALLLSVFLLCPVSCGSPEPVVETVVETAIVKETVVSEVPVTVEVTRIAEVEVTRLFEVTRVSEVEVVVTATPNPISLSGTPLEGLRDGLAREVSDNLEVIDAVAKVTLVNLDVGLLEIELLTAHRTREAQPEVSWQIVNILAGVFASAAPEARLVLMGSEDLVLRLTTYSAEGEHMYASATDYATMVDLHSQSISYEEWIELADAGFQ